MTRGVSRITGKSEGGKARTDPELLAQAVAMVDAGTHTPDQAAAEIGVVGNTVRRAIVRRDTERASSGAVEVVPVTPGALAGLPPELPADVSQAIVATADPDKARAVRRLVAGMNGGAWDGEALESLAATWECSLADVQALVIEASIAAGKCVLPPELAREEALAALRHVREKAKSAADWKSVTLATGEILKIQLAAGEGESLSKAQFVDLARRLIAAVAPYPGAREAAIRVMFPRGVDGG